MVTEADLPKVLAMGQRENCPVSAVGSVTGDGNVSIILHIVCVYVLIFINKIDCDMYRR